MYRSRTDLKKYLYEKKKENLDNNKTTNYTIHLEKKDIKQKQTRFIKKVIQNTKSW